MKFGRTNHGPTSPAMPMGANWQYANYRHCLFCLLTPRAPKPYHQSTIAPPRFNTTLIFRRFSQDDRLHPREHPTPQPHQPTHSLPRFHTQYRKNARWCLRSRRRCRLNLRNTSPTWPEAEPFATLLDKKADTRNKIRYTEIYTRRRGGGNAKGRTGHIHTTEQA